MQRDRPPRGTVAPVVGRTLFIPHAGATIAITCTAMGTDVASVEDDLADVEAVAATIQLR